MTWRDRDERTGRLRLAVVATHPIQYYAPVFRRLAEGGRLDLHVFYGWEGPASRPTHDPGFGRAVQWDLPLLDGYHHTFVPNESTDPGTHHFRGITSRALVPAIHHWGPDAVLVYGWAYASHLAALRAFHRRVPVFIRGDSTLLDERPGPKQWLRRAWLRWVYRHADVALYVGTESRRYFEAHGLRGDRLAWAPHAVENERFADPDGALEREAVEWRRSLGIADEAKTILFAGKLEPKKAPEVLLRAFLARDRADEHLLVGGSGPLEGALTELAAGHPRVHFLGFQNQSRMPVVYRLGDLFVLPSRGPGETWGLAVNEAMASGRPVIVTDRVGCAPDLVVEGRTGTRCRADDEHALGAALERLLATPELQRGMRASAAAHVRDWSIDRQAECIEAAVERRCSPVGRVSHSQQSAVSS